MSVIITGMKKLKDCYNCKFHTNYRTNDYGSFCECMFDDEYNRINLLEHKIPNFCPLKSIDGLIEKLEKKKIYRGWLCYANMDDVDADKTHDVALDKAIEIIKEYCKEE